ncbi:MAG: thiamine phosphate synthase [Aerococcus sp.]|nr:thiamine phosphate synthase [Aerococcus sp.]
MTFDPEHWKKTTIFDPQTLRENTPSSPKKSKAKPTFDPNILTWYFVAGTQDFNGDESAFLAQLERLLEAGITAFQFREKGPGSLEAFPTKRQHLAERCHALTKQYHIPLFIDDDVDLAIAIHAEGIHTGQKDEAITSVIGRVPTDMMIGLSCNTTSEIHAANQIAAIDYIGVGTVFPTATKSDAGQALGLEKLTMLTQLSIHPVVAIGGITEERVFDVFASGVDGIAAVRLFATLSNPKMTFAHCNHHR